MNYARTEQTFLRAAKDFITADLDVQLARSQWREIHDLHGYGGVCCLPWEDADNEIKRPSLPRRKWCAHCKRITAQAVSYPDALWKRRAAKVRMKRAYKKLVT
ncbi:MAG: hypothetical protein WBD25_07335 [Terriglobales bacterium]|jgi:hypothetical protein